MSAAILPLLRSGGSLRYRPAYGFYVVVAGKTHPVSQSEAVAAIESRAVRPTGENAFGVHFFALGKP